MSLSRRFQTFLHIKNILDELKTSHKWEKKYIKFELAQHWKEFVGENFCEFINDFDYDDYKLTVYFDNAAIKNEFLYHISLVIQRINAYFGDEVVKEIRIK